MRRLGLLALIVCAVGLLYSRSAKFAFVDYDDQEYVIENPNMRGGLTAANAKWAFLSAGYADNWHPLAWISMMADVTLAGPLDDERWASRDNRVAHVMHAHNVALHVLNAGLLYLLLLVLARRLFPPAVTDDLVCAFLALLWAVHPLRVEVVCWASERKELTCVCFMLLSMLAYLMQSRPRGSSLIPRLFYLLSLLFFVLAILAKPVAVTLPVVLFAFDWIFGGRMRIAKLLPFALGSAACCLLTMASQTTALKSGADQLLCQRLESVFVAPLVYLGQTAWPAGLSSFYKFTWKMDWLGVGCGVLLVAAMAWVCVRWLMRRETWAGLAAFGVAWAYVGLVPMLGVVKVGPQEHADRYTYWIGCGLSAVLLVGWRQLAEREAVRRFVATYARQTLWGAVGVLAVLAFVTAGRVPVWQNTISLFRDSLPKSWNGEHAGILARHLEAIGHPAALEEAEMWLRRTASYRSTTSACAELALFLSHRTYPKVMFGSLDPYAEARQLAHESLSGWAEQSVAWEALGNCDAQSDKWQSAIECYEKGLPYAKKPEIVRQKIALCRERLREAGKAGRK